MGRLGQNPITYMKLVVVAMWRDKFDLCFELCALIPIKNKVSKF
jgi:hypothetical protein